MASALLWAHEELTDCTHDAPPMLMKLLEQDDAAKNRAEGKHHVKDAQSKVSRNTALLKASEGGFKRSGLNSDR